MGRVKTNLTNCLPFLQLITPDLKLIWTGAPFVLILWYQGKDCSYPLLSGQTRSLSLLLGHPPCPYPIVSGQRLLRCNHRVNWIRFSHVWTRSLFLLDENVDLKDTKDKAAADSNRFCFWEPRAAHLCQHLLLWWEWHPHHPLSKGQQIWKQW